MKLNFNYCLLISLILIILVSCLGTLLYEGFDNNTNDKKSMKSNKNNNKDNLGDDRDKHGCLPSAGEKWCSTLDRCIKPFEEDCPTDDESGKQYCGRNTFWDREKQMCINKRYKKHHKNHRHTRHTRHTRDNRDGDHDDRYKNELDNNYDYNNNYRNPDDMLNDNLDNMNVNNVNNNDFILRSKIVPPVCPACPPVTACPSNKKCPPCPAPEPIQPCPPCERCPEPSFKCEKVPNYSSINNELLPRPLLTDFSEFGV